MHELCLTMDYSGDQCIAIHHGGLQYSATPGGVVLHHVVRISVVLHHVVRISVVLHHGGLQYSATPGGDTCGVCNAWWGYVCCYITVGNSLVLYTTVDYSIVQRLVGIRVVLHHVVGDQCSAIHQGGLHYSATPGGDTCAATSRWGTVRCYCTVGISFVPTFKIVKNR